MGDHSYNKLEVIISTLIVSRHKARLDTMFMRERILHRFMSSRNGALQFRKRGARSAHRTIPITLCKILADIDDYDRGIAHKLRVSRPNGANYNNAPTTTTNIKSKDCYLDWQRKNKYVLLHGFKLPEPTSQNINKFENIC